MSTEVNSVQNNHAGLRDPIRRRGDPDPRGAHPGPVGLMPSTVLTVDTPQGPGRCFVDPAEDPTALLVLGHGAGGGANAADLELLARRLPVLGITVVRFEQPWRTAGRRIARSAGHARRGLDGRGDGAARPALGGRARCFVGGRSAGARVACRTAQTVGAAGVVCLAFPLHLPGRPEKSRAAELLGAGVPRLVLQGSKDTFGTPAEIQAAIGVGRRGSGWSSCRVPTTVSGWPRPRRSAPPTSGRGCWPRLASSSAGRGIAWFRPALHCPCPCSPTRSQSRRGAVGRRYSRT